MIFFVCFALSLHAALEATVFHVKTRGHCFLFGQILEKERVFVDGCTFLCWSFIVIQYMLAVASVYITLFPLQSRLTSWYKLFWVYAFAAVTNAIIFSWGFYSVCNSLKQTPRCSDEAVFNIEFKYFTPKYVDAGRFVSMFSRIMISIWLNIFFWFLFCGLNYRYKHLTSN